MPELNLPWRIEKPMGAGIHAYIVYDSKGWEVGRVRSETVARMLVSMTESESRETNGDGLIA